MWTKRLPYQLAVALFLWLLCASAVFARGTSSPDDDFQKAAGTAGAFFIGALICIGLVIVVSFVLAIFLGYWMYNDANARGENGVMWGLLGFFLTWIALIIWIIVRPKTKGGVRRKKRARAE